MPTKREQMIECKRELEDWMCDKEHTDIWQDKLLWWICKAVCLLLEKEVKKNG